MFNNSPVEYLYWNNTTSDYVSLNQPIETIKLSEQNTKIVFDDLTFITCTTDPVNFDDIPF